MIDVKESENCTFCNAEPETVAHLFWYCPMTEEFITAMKTELLNKYNVSVCVNLKTWLFPHM